MKNIQVNILRLTFTYKSLCYIDTFNPILLNKIINYRPSSIINLHTSLGPRTIYEYLYREVFECFPKPRP